MEFLNQSAFLKALGWSLLNSFWQFAVLWLLFLLLTTAKKNLTSGLKHALALAMLMTGFLWFMAGLGYRYFAYPEIPGFKVNADFLSDSFGFGLYKTITAFLNNNLTYISAVYLLVVAALFIKFFRYFYYSHKLQTQGLIKIKAELRMYVEQLAMKLDIKKKVNVWLSHYIDTPIIVGFLKPTILIPLACMNQLTLQQLEAVILHELAHVKRNDYLLNLFIAMTEIVFFFNPFSRLFTRIIQQERENSCDDWVLQFKFDRYQYASALLSLEKNRGSYLPLTVAATGEDNNKTLLLRIKRIMQLQVTKRVNSSRLVAYILSVGLLTFVALFKPGDVIRNLNTAIPVVQPVLFSVIENHEQVIQNKNPVQAAPVKINAKPVKKIPVEEATELSLPAAGPGFSDILVINVADIAMEGYDNTSRLIASVKRENIEFSKTDNLQPLIPIEAEAGSFPFVPGSSFSYFFVDTTKPKVKAETYYERSARESLVKAKKAVQQIDWQRIEKQLNKSVDIAKLRKEIEKSLEEVNWQQINEEVKLALAKENTERMKALRQEAEELNRYKAQQIQLQKIDQQLNLQRELYEREMDKQKSEIRIHGKQEKKKSGRIIVYI